MKKNLSLFLSLLIFCSCAHSPQVTKIPLNEFTIDPEMRYEVKFMRDRKPYGLEGMGKDMSLEDRYLVFPQEHQRVGFNEIKEVDGEKRVGHHAWIGALIGAVTGTLLGGLTAQASCSDCNFFHGFDTKTTILGFGIGAAAGGIAGGLIGYKIPKTSKVVVTPN